MMLGGGTYNRATDEASSELEEKYMFDLFVCYLGRLESIGNDLV